LSEVKRVGTCHYAEYRFSTSARSMIVKVADGKTTPIANTIAIDSNPTQGIYVNESFITTRRQQERKYIFSESFHNIALEELICLLLNM